MLNRITEIINKLDQSGLGYSIVEEGPLFTFYVEEEQPWMREFEKGWSGIFFRKSWYTFKENTND